MSLRQKIDGLIDSLRKEVGSDFLGDVRTILAHPVWHSTFAQTYRHCFINRVNSLRPVV